MLFTGLGRSVLGKTVLEVSSTARGRRPRAVLETSFKQKEAEFRSKEYEEEKKRRGEAEKRQDSMMQMFVQQNQLMLSLISKLADK